MKLKPVIFGEVLYDCFPDGSAVLGGAPFNVAWHLHAFRQQPLMITRVGNDDKGQQIRNAMLDWGMDVSEVTIDDAHPTGIVAVTISNNEPHYNIVDNSAWDFIPAAELNPNENYLLYHGTLALRHAQPVHSLMALRNKASKIFVDINLRSPWYRLDEVRKIINAVDWLKLNEAELDELVPESNDHEGKIRHLHDQFGVKNIIITLGEAGASLSSQTGNTINIKPEKAQQVVDTVGAGDAFSSVVLTGIINQWPHEIMLKRAQQFASKIVQNRGATISDKQFYNKHIQDWQ